MFDAKELSHRPGHLMVVVMRRDFVKFAFIPALLFLFIVVQGCVVATKQTVISPEILAMFKGTYKIDPFMGKHKPRTIAVLPFVDESESQRGTETVRKYFYNHFSSLPFKDMELYRVDHLLRKAGFTDPEIIHNKTPQELGEILNVDAIIYGSISNFDKIFAVIYSQVSVGARVEMYDAKTGHFLWSGKHVARIHEGGVSTTPIGIIATVIAASMNIRDIQLLRACDDLFRDMVKTIPVPAIADVARPPVITILSQDTRGIPRKAGEEITIVMKGTPNMQAYFDIGDYQKGIDMKEMEPGGYLGIYRVVPGDNVAGASIVGHLTDDVGNTVEWVDAVGTVTLDTTPPDKPQHLEIVGRDTFVSLDWYKNTQADLAEYLIYRSLTPLSGFEQIAKIEFNRYRDEGLKNYQKYFYKLSAVDKAGNESEKTDPHLGMPVLPGPTPVSGNITVDTIWYSGASPYIIEGEILVKDKTQLTIEPGTVVKSIGPALIIHGRLNAVGNEKHLIHFSGMKDQNWEGILFNNVREKENSMKFCQIKDAKIGILCRASSPIVESCELTSNNVGMKIEGAFSKPHVIRNVVHENESTGILIASGAQPVLMNNKLRDNAGGAIKVTNAEPVIKQNSIIQNSGFGIMISNSQASVTENNIYDNTPFNIVGTMKGEAVNARNNWWGSANGLDVLSTITGRIDVQSILDDSYPGGKSLDLPILESGLDSSINSDSYLILSNSPYMVIKDIVVDNGATLYIEPGVSITFNQKTSIIIKDGGVTARGTKDNPIEFTASGASPSPGFYLNAFRFTEEKTRVSSYFEYCIVKHATTAFDVQFGTPEISYCLIANNAQSGIYCRNDAAPKILYNTLSDNLGEGAIRCVGMSKPIIHYNNFVGNSVSIQSFSSIYVDARHNWWGSDPPDKNQIWGENINIDPWLRALEVKAFSGKDKVDQGKIIPESVWHEAVCRFFPRYVSNPDFGINRIQCSHFRTKSYSDR